VPFSPDLERLMYPTAERIAAAVRHLCDLNARDDRASVRGMAAGSMRTERPGARQAVAKVEHERVSS
jgi:hypothetical protein